MAVLYVWYVQVYVETDIDTDTDKCMYIYMYTDLCMCAHTSFAQEYMEDTNVLRQGSLNSTSIRVQGSWVCWFI